MEAGSIGARIAEAVAPVGLNLVGATPVADYDRIARAELRIAARRPWARTAIVVGNGGGALWRFVAARAGERPAADANPIDELVEEVFERRVAPLLARRAVRFEIAFAHRFPGEPLSFVDLGRSAGLGAPSLLRVLVHPVFGPWIALRAVVLVDFEADADRPAAAFDPCPGCRERACVASCPAGAVRLPDGWDVAACVEHRLATGDCESLCHARFDCVIGREHRYPEGALAHHQRRAWQAMKPGLDER
jgi:ferredoxin-like protein FixX